MVQTQLGFMEETKTNYLDEARATAKRLLRSRMSVTTDDIWEHFPPPKIVNAKIMGQVFRHPDFKATGQFVATRRASSHGRYIQKFELKNSYDYRELMRPVRLAEETH